MCWSCFCLFCTVWNHHWTHHLRQYFLLFPSKSKERKRKCHPNKEPGRRLRSFRCSTEQQWSSSTTWSCLVWNVGGKKNIGMVFWKNLQKILGGMMVRVKEGVAGQLFIQTSQDRWVVSNPVWIVYPKACGNDTIGRLHLFSHGCFNR